MLKKDIIGLVVPANIKYSPYVQNYIKNLEQESVDYRIISWNKKGLEETTNYSFEFKVDDHNRLKILLGHFIFACRCKKYINNNCINKLIIFTIAPVFFLGPHFISIFRKRFILDIRDDSPFRRLASSRLNKICEKAYGIVISSPNFQDWMEAKAVLCHNADLDLLFEYLEYEAHSHLGPIRIMCAGVMIEAEENIRFLKAMNGDNRFIFKYIGRNCKGKEEIQKFVKGIGYTNVEFEGTYDKGEIIDKYRANADFVNIIREQSIVNKNALPNKLYEAAIAGVPIIVYDHNEAVAKYVKEYHLGLVISADVEGSLNDYLWDRIETFDYNQYNQGRIAFLKKIVADMEEFKDKVSRFILL